MKNLLKKALLVSLTAIMVVSSAVVANPVKAEAASKGYVPKIMDWKKVKTTRTDVDKYKVTIPRMKNATKYQIQYTTRRGISLSPALVSFNDAKKAGAKCITVKQFKGSKKTITIKNKKFKDVTHGCGELRIRYYDSKAKRWSAWSHQVAFTNAGIEKVNLKVVVKGYYPNMTMTVVRVGKR